MQKEKLVGHEESLDREERELTAIQLGLKGTQAQAILQSER